MTQKYYAIVTNLGAAKIANAAALGTKLNITQMAVGDGGGALPTPNASQTKLVNEVRRAAINMLSVDPANASQVIAEQVIPENEGGFWIREMGLFDADGTLIAVCNTPETYKPALQEGSGRTQTVRMILIVNSTDTITLKIDPSVVLATRKYVDDSILTVRQYADKLMADHLAAENPHDQYMQTANALAEIRDAGLIAEVLKNLGLGEGAPVIGSPFPWPHAKMPNELFTSMSGMVFLKSNGASFSGTLYPKLALAYPALKLTDLRGEFIRGWDDGRGADAARAILSAQDSTYLRTGTMDFLGRENEGTSVGIGIPYSNADSVTRTLTPPSGSFRAPNNTNIDGATQRDNGVNGTSMNNAYGSDGNVWISARPRNVAFNYIVRAA